MSEGLAFILGILSLVISNSIIQVIVKWKDVSYYKQNQELQVKINYLNPLRVYASELYYRWEHIISKIESKEQKGLEPFYYIDEPKQIEGKEKEWFYQNGYYLISTSYIIASLFAQYYKVRLLLPVLYIKNKNYKLLIQLLNILNENFRKSFGIYHILQYDIGQNMYCDNTCEKIISYSDFCNILQNNDINESFLNLIKFCLEIGRGKRKEELYQIKQALFDLILCLDHIIKSETILKKKYN
jgi:hypothetical protein